MTCPRGGVARLVETALSTEPIIIPCDVYKSGGNLFFLESDLGQRPKWCQRKKVQVPKIFKMCDSVSTDYMDANIKQTTPSESEIESIQDLLMIGGLQELETFQLITRESSFVY